MSKNTVGKEKEVKTETNNVVDSVDKAKDAIESLKVQLVEHRKQEQYHSTMAVKAEGALEVLLQLHPQEENETK